MKLQRIIALCILWLGSCVALYSQAEERVLVVSAAASLKDAFVDLGKAFEKDHPGVKVAFNFSGSSQLASQIEQGAPVDVYASAEMAFVKRLASRNLLAQYDVMAHNKLTVIVSNSAKLKIDSLQDLSSKGLRLVMAARQVPIAGYTRQFLSNVGRAGLYDADYGVRVLANTVSEEPDVRILATKVALGEGDAGIVYVSDITGDVRNKVRQIPIADSLNVIVEYGVAVVKGSAHPEIAQAFYNRILSSEGQALLIKRGLMPAR